MAVDVVAVDTTGDADRASTANGVDDRDDGERPSVLADCVQHVQTTPSAVHAITCERAMCIMIP